MHDVETNVYNQPALAFKYSPDISIPGGPSPVIVPMTLTVSGVPTAASTPTQVIVTPIVMPSGLVVGSNVLGDAPINQPRISLEGTMDTPLTIDGTDHVPAILVNNTIRITWAEYVVMCMEGRVTSTYTRWDPLWYRDPFGRQYNNPRIVDFTAQYVEAVPGRTSFTMQLKV